MIWRHHLPAAWAADDRSAYTVLGLIGDTHLTHQGTHLPAAVTTLFAGVDTILHAGDVGLLHVLDDLRAVAPTLAVIGNREPAATRAALPRREVVQIPGHTRPWRVGLVHGHHDSEIDEMTARANPEWAAKFAFLASQFPVDSVDVVVSGHLHVPFVVEMDSPPLLLVNPGVPGQPDRLFDQRVRSVCFLYLHRQRAGRDGRAAVLVDVTDPRQTIALPPSWRESLAAAQVLTSPPRATAQTLHVIRQSRLLAARDHSPTLRLEHVAMACVLEAETAPAGPVAAVFTARALSLAAWRAALEQWLSEQTIPAAPTPTPGVLRVAPGVVETIIHMVETWQRDHGPTPMPLEVLAEGVLTAVVGGAPTPVPSPAAAGEGNIPEAGEMVG